MVIGDGISFASEVENKLGSRANLQIFKNFGTAMIAYNDLEIEFVGSRKESYQKSSRNPVVSIGTFEDDISRRDFTINSIAISLNEDSKGKIIDLFDGVHDLKKGIIKTPKDPKIIPKWSQNNPNVIPNLSQTYLKKIPKRSHNYPTFIRKQDHKIIPK